MAYIIEKTGKSVEEAINMALVDLNCTRGDAEIEILEAPAKGFLGLLGAKQARVRVWKKEGSPAGAEDNELYPDDAIAHFIVKVVGHIGISASVSKQEDDEAVTYTITGNNMGAVIGRRGDTLDAIQYLSNKLAGKKKEDGKKRILIDSENYRQRRQDTLVRLALRLASKAKRSGRRVVLEPMSPMERRIIHMALQNDPEIKTQSEGGDPYRRMAIYPLAGDRRYPRGDSGLSFERRRDFDDDKRGYDDDQD